MNEKDKRRILDQNMYGQKVLKQVLPEHAPTRQEIYDRMMEGYVPVPKGSGKDELSFRPNGSVVEITLGDKKFAVHDAARLERVVELVKKNDTRLTQVQENLRTAINTLNKQAQHIHNMKAEIKELQEKLRNGYQYGSGL